VPFRILHVADPHFSHCHFHFPGDPDRIGREHARELVHFLKLHYLTGRQRFNAAILSGDFTFACNPDGYIAARAFIDDIAEIVEPEGFVIIPGNHDIDLRKPVVIGRLSLPTDVEDAERPFRAFLDSIRHHIGPVWPYLSSVVRIERAPGPALVIAGLNSCRVERWDAQGWGYIGVDQIHYVASQLREVARTGDLVIVVAHHNLLPIWDVGLRAIAATPASRKFSFTLDAGTALQELANLGMGVLLHGHTHVSSIKRVWGYGDAIQREYPTLVLGAGSLGVTGCHTDPPHHFQTIELRENGRIICKDWNSFHNPQRNTPRTWGQVPKNNAGTILVGWDSKTADAAIRGMAQKAQTARYIFECVQSWSALRVFRTNPQVWPGVLTRIHADVNTVRPATTQQELDRAIRRIFRRPPDDETLTQLPLAEYVKRVLDQ
jgi:3',5'-cyclic AMP phosphodiesterase CpdA